MTLKRLTKNTIAGFRQFNLTQWIISMIGWLKSWPEAIPKRWARIPIPLQPCVTNARMAAADGAGFHSRAASSAATASIPAWIILGLLAIAAVCPASAQTQAKRAKKPSTKSSSAATKRTRSSTRKSRPNPPPASPGEKQLTQLARTLRDNPSATAYAVLSAYATKNAKNELGADAALALGYYDLTRDKPDLAMGWLRKAAGDKDLREYVQYWQAQASVALGQKEEGLAQLQDFRREFPDSVMSEQAVTSLAQTALAMGKNEVALAALDGYPNLTGKPALLLLRAQARENLPSVKAEKLLSAADYLDLYYRFPLSDEAKAAGQKIPALQAALGDQFPATPMQTQMSRAEAFFNAKRWHDARAEFAALLPRLSGADRERADLRIAQCDSQSGN